MEGYRKGEWTRDLTGDLTGNLTRKLTEVCDVKKYRKGSKEFWDS